METLRLIAAILALGSLWVTVYLYIKGIKAKEFTTANTALVICIILNVLRIIVENLL